VLRQLEECEGLPTGPHTISRRLAVRPDANAEERALVRRVLRSHLWTQDHDGRTPLKELLPALSAALGVQIESSPPIPPDWKCLLVILNMRLSAALTDLAGRMDVRFTLSRLDPMAESDRVQTVRLDEPFGEEDGLVELTVERPDGWGRVDLFARVQPDACLCACLFDDNSRFLAPAGIDDTGAGPMYHKAATRLDRGTVVRPLRRRRVGPAERDSVQLGPRRLPRSRRLRLDRGWQRALRPPEM